MQAMLALLLVAGVIVVREGVRWLAHGELSVFALRAPARRVTALVAGLVATYGAVVAIAFVFASCFGRPTGKHDYVVDAVIAGSVAEGKLVAGDRIVALDGTPVYLGRPSLGDRVTAKAGAPVEVTVLRAGSRIAVTLTPQPSERDGKPIWLLGIQLGAAAERATDGALAFALATPAREIARLARDSDAEAGGVTRLIEEYRRDRDVVHDAFASALRLASALLLLAAVFDLFRIALVIRDRLRG